MRDLNAEYEAAKKRIEDLRAVAWSTGFGEYDVCGIKLKPLTVQAWIDLIASENPLFIPSEDGYSRNAVASYLWRNSTHYTQNKTVLSGLRKWRIEQKVFKGDSEKIMSGIEEHIEDAFEEFPKQVSDGSYSRSSGFAKIDNISAMVDEVANRYGQMPYDVLEIPLLHLFQLQKIIRTSTIPGYKLAEPTRIYKLNGDILGRLNNG